MSYSDIIERLAKATGPDREIDVAVAVLIDGYYEIPPRWDGDGLGYGQCRQDGSRVEPGQGGDQLVPPYTASLDASIALVERMLPGHGRLIEKSRLTTSEPLYGATLYDSFTMTGIPTSVTGEGEHEHSEAIALLIAMLRTLSK